MTQTGPTQDQQVTQVTNVTQVAQAPVALTPMMAQYHQIKSEYKDFILFFRLGDFYEMFFEDAVTASAVLEITLTKRASGGGEKAALCGVPYHSADGYIAKLVNSGYKVAVCEQMEDPALAKGIVKREVVRIVTPGTVTDPAMLEEKRHNYILSLAATGQGLGMAYGDVTTGLLRTTTFKSDQVPMLLDEVIRLSPSEIVVADSLPFMNELSGAVERIAAVITKKDERFFSETVATSLIKRIYGVQNLEGLGLYQNQGSVVATGGLLAYLEETQKQELSHFKRLDVYQYGQHMLIDHFTRINLELTQTMRQKDKRGSLLWVLDQTKTAMGGRLLKSWIEEPLLDLEAIHGRLDVVKFFFEEVLVRADLRHYLEEVYDLERLLTKAVFGSLNGRDAVALRSSLAVLPGMYYLLSGHEDQALAGLVSGFDTLEDLQGILENALLDDQPFSIREGNLFKDGYHQELDELRHIIRHGKEWLLEIEEQERERTGIRNLKIGFNKVFGYYVEISKGSIKNAPDNYIRKQTLSNCERYILPALKEIEDKILGAEERVNKLEYELFAQIRGELVANGERLRQMAGVLAQLDVLTNFAQVSERNGYTPPVLSNSDVLEIIDGRHPVVERIGADEGFVPNDAHLDGADNQIYIVTGPNMAGKSTFLRQVALITLMGQIGCFVPAKEAHIGIVDRVFTRVGASDDLFQGQSTFMVEMNELANILNHATHKSLIILDEIGRGTATYDGLSIAWSVVEYLSSNIGAKSIFATHYHELTELEGKIKGVKNFCVAVREEADHIVFLRKIIRGGANQSFGIQVARLAGVPEPVIRRAKAILLELEDSDITRQKAMPADFSDSEEDFNGDGESASENLLDAETQLGKGPLAVGKLLETRKNRLQASKPSQDQISFEDIWQQELVSEIHGLDISNMTPLHAMTKLNELVERTKQKKK